MGANKSNASAFIFSCFVSTQANYHLQLTYKFKKSGLLLYFFFVENAYLGYITETETGDNVNYMCFAVFYCDNVTKALKFLFLLNEEFIN